MAIYPQSMADETIAAFEETDRLEYLKKFGPSLAKKFGVGLDELEESMKLETKKND